MPRANYTQILKLALPMVGSLSSYSLIGVIDLWLVGHLGATALAAVGLGTFAMFTASSLLSGLFPAVQSQTARAIGAKQAALAEQLARNGLAIALLAGLVFAAILMFLAPHFMVLLSPDPAVQQAVLLYFTIRCLGLPAENLLHAFMGACMGWGDSQRVFYSTVAMHCLNVLISSILIFGVFGFEPLGLMGAAIGSAISTWLGVLIYVGGCWRWLWQGGLKLLYIKKLLHIAMPACLLDISISAGWTVLLVIIAQLGTAELAVVTVVLQLVVVLLLPSHGFGMAAGSLAGWSLGENNPTAARQNGWQTVRLAMFSAALLAVLGGILSQPLLGLFLHEPELLAMALPVFYITLILLVPDAVGAVLLEATLGISATGTATLLGIISMWFFGIAAAWGAQSLGFGLFGVWAVFYIHRLVQSALFAGAWPRVIAGQASQP